MPPGQVPEQVALHEFHNHPDVLALEGHPKELDNVLVPAASKDCDLFQEQLLLCLPYIALKDLDCNLMNLVQNALVDLHTISIAVLPLLLSPPYLCPLSEISSCFLRIEGLIVCDKRTRCTRKQSMHQTILFILNITFCCLNSQVSPSEGGGGLLPLFCSQEQKALLIRAEMLHVPLLSRALLLQQELTLSKTSG